MLFSSSEGFIINPSKRGILAYKQKYCVIRKSILI